MSQVYAQPRYFKIGRRWVNAYQVFLCVGIYAGTLVCAAVAQGAGASVLAAGMAALACGLAGVAGARAYHVLVNWTAYAREHSTRAVWDSARGGMNVFGGFLFVLPVAAGLAWALGLAVPTFWDALAAGVLAGAVWIRLGCVFNGCCEGMPTQAWYGIVLHDTHGVRTRRVPVQFLEMGWWALGGAGGAWLWAQTPAPGTLALAVLCWYGIGRFWLEPLRAAPDRVLGRIRIDRLVAGLIASGAGGLLIVRMMTA